MKQRGKEAVQYVYVNFQPEKSEIPIRQFRMGGRSLMKPHKPN